MSSAYPNYIHKNNISHVGYYGIWIGNNSSNNNITGNALTNCGHEGIFLENCTHGNVAENFINQSRIDGIGAWLGSFHNITGNTILASGCDGVSFNSSSESLIAGNRIITAREGICLESSESNMIIENVVVNTVIGMNLSFSSNNMISNNNIMNNTTPALANGPLNVWDNSTRGNYWGDYEGEDRNGDGMGDTPYSINADNTDRYPLIVPNGLFPVFHEQKSFDCLITANVTVCQIELDQNKSVCFRTIGHGWANVTVPRELSGGAFKVLINNAETLSLTSWNEERTNTTIHYECNVPGSNNVKIEGEMKLIGDLDGDRRVNILDLSTVARHFGEKLEP